MEGHTHCWLVRERVLFGCWVYGVAIVLVVALMGFNSVHVHLKLRPESAAPDIL